MKIFALYDKKSAEYFALSVYPNFAMFKRSVYPEVNSTNPHSNLANFPEDFDIYCLGEFDPKTGSISPSAEFVANCLDLKKEV